MSKKIFFQEIFYATSASLVIFYVLEWFWPGVVISHFSLNWLLLIWLIAGILLMVGRLEKYE